MPSGVVGLPKWTRQVESIAKKAEKEEKQAEVTVGYSAEYAPYVHEKIEMKWRGIPRSSGIGSYWDSLTGRGSAKFLERSIRKKTLQKKMVRTIRDMIRQDESFADAIAEAAVMLKEDSQRWVPFEYGDLHDSAYVANFITGHTYE